MSPFLIVFPSLFKSLSEMLFEQPNKIVKTMNNIVKRDFILICVATVVVSFVADYVRFNCQTATSLKRAKNVEFTNDPAIKFTTCYQLGFVFSFHRTISFSILALSRFCFSGRQKKRLKTDKLFCNFWSVCWIVRIANVLGCVRWLIYFYCFPSPNIFLFIEG